jgi:predicted Zn-dependent protease
MLAFPAVQLLHCYAVFKLKQGHQEVAMQLLQQLEVKEPNNGFLCHTQGQLAQQQGELAAARLWFTRGTRCKSKLPAAALDATVLRCCCWLMRDACGQCLPCAG